MATPVLVLDEAAIEGAGTPILKLLPDVGLTVSTPAGVSVILDAGRVTVLPPDIDKLLPAKLNVGLELIV